MVCKGYEVAKDFDPFKSDLTQKLQKVCVVDDDVMLYSLSSDWLIGLSMVYLSK